jgi:hypothetical protein
VNPGVEDEGALVRLDLGRMCRAAARRWAGTPLSKAQQIDEWRNVTRDRQDQFGPLGNCTKWIRCSLLLISASGCRRLVARRA